MFRLESYFDHEEAFAPDAISEGRMRAVIKYAPIALKEPENYESRGQLMWTSSLALNGLISTGKNFMWSCHYIEHELSANHDITHGAWLATLTPKWMRYVRSDATVDKFYAYAVNVWSMTPATEDKFAVANEGIEATEEFFRSIGLPMTLAEFKIDDSRLEETAAKAVEVGYLGGAYVPLDEKDVVEILKMCM